MTTNHDTPRTDAFYPSDADFWEEEAKRNCSNSQYWRDRAEKAEAEVERLKLYQPDPQAIVEIAREQQDSLKKLVAEIGTVRLELFDAQGSEAVWKTEADKADQRRLEAEAEVERLTGKLHHLLIAQQSYNSTYSDLFAKEFK
jgi:hypothetical protein